MDPLCIDAVVVEDGLHARSGELVAQAGRLLTTELVVVCPAHLVGPSVARGLREGDAPLGENLLKPAPVDRPGVHERLGDAVSETLLEAADGERRAAQIPVRLGRLRLRQDIEALSPHEIVVDLMEPVSPRRTSPQRLTSEVVVVHEVDVVVKVPSRTVRVRHDEVVRGIHPLGQLHPELVDRGGVIGVMEVELVRGKVLRVGVELVLPAPSGRQLLGTRNEFLRRCQRARESRGTSRSRQFVTPSTSSRTPERVDDAVPGRRGGLHVYGAHKATSSPR